MCYFVNKTDSFFRGDSCVQTALVRLVPRVRSAHAHQCVRWDSSGRSEWTQRERCAYARAHTSHRDKVYAIRFLTTLIETWETRNITDKMFQVVFENWLWYGINVEREQLLTFGIILIVVSFRFQRKTALLTTADKWSDKGEYKQQFTFRLKCI